MIVAYGPIGFLADPVATSPLAAAASWIEQTLLGTVATAIAIVCVASVGWLMLAGRLEVRRGLTVVLGCFVLFGATTIVGGLMNAVRGQANAPVVQSAPPPTVEVPEVGNSVAPYDPYAGASVRR